MKELLKLVNICQSYHKKIKVSRFLWDSVVTSTVIILLKKTATRRFFSALEVSYENSLYKFTIEFDFDLDV